MRVPVEPCHSIGASRGVGGVVVTRVGRGGRGGSLRDVGKLNRPANHATDRCLLMTGEKIRRDKRGVTNTFSSSHTQTLTISEFPLLFSFLWGGIGRRGTSLFPSLMRRERSEFHGSKLDGGKKGGITAFSLSLGSRVRGAPLLSWNKWEKILKTTQYVQYYNMFNNDQNSSI